MIQCYLMSFVLIERQVATEIIYWAYKPYNKKKKNSPKLFYAKKGSIMFFFSSCFVEIVFEHGKSWILTFILFIGAVGFCWASCKLYDDAFCFKHQTLPLNYCDYALFIFRDKLKGIVPDMKMTFTCKWWNKALSPNLTVQKGQCHIWYSSWKPWDFGLLLTVLHPPLQLLYAVSWKEASSPWIVFHDQPTVCSHTLPCRDGIFTPIYTLWRSADTLTINSSYIPANDRLQTRLCPCAVWNGCANT